MTILWRGGGQSPTSIRSRRALPCTREGTSPFDPRLIKQVSRGRLSSGGVWGRAPHLLLCLGEPPVGEIPIMPRLRGLLHQNVPV